MMATRVSAVSGVIFAALVALLAAGWGFFEVVHSTSGGPDAEGVRSWGLAALGLAWMFGLWGALVALMAFLVASVGEALATSESETSRRRTARELGGSRLVAASQRRPDEAGGAAVGELSA